MAREGEREEREGMDKAEANGEGKDTRVEDQDRDKNEDKDEGRKNSQEAGIVMSRERPTDALGWKVRRKLDVPK